MVPKFVGWCKYHVASRKHLITQDLPTHNPAGSAPSPGSQTRSPQPSFWQYAPISEICFSRVRCGGCSQDLLTPITPKAIALPGTTCLALKENQALGMAGSIAIVSNAASTAQAPSKGHCLPGNGKEWGKSFILLHSSFCLAEAQTFTDSPIPKSLQAKGRAQ